MVTTPHEVALVDVRRGIHMFAKIEVPVLAIVENMSYFVCPDNDKKYDIFGHGGGTTVAKQFNLPLLGEIPIDPAIRQGGDTGNPAFTIEGTATRQAFTELASKVAELAVDPA
jgi:ATP-binding protein involved in chromosome partitioning